MEQLDLQDRTKAADKDKKPGVKLSDTDEQKQLTKTKSS